ncbi:hypothetical protein [Enemella evansiae]|uniref:hypothetical protein n=1 Tax=Enemella evansiae TaxID=2016499 RepID=UPI000B97BBAA|nr:hypothetical protein [Enemella evansiae]OYO04109.1 hypothetical protein CGZ97_12110 [Enemella evansiae]OYO13210.1 hypothetical protein CGZ98_05950 [Enemella evansiae]
MTRQQRSAAAYAWRFGLAVALYTVLVLVALPLARWLPEGSPQRYLLACLPALGVLVGIWALWRYLAEVDEFQSKKLLHSLAFSVAGTVLVTVMVGFAQSVGAPALPWIWVTPLWAVLFGIGTAITAWRYR